MTKREVLLGAIEAAGEVWGCRTTDKEKRVELVIMTSEHAKALADAAKLALAMIDRAALIDAETLLGAGAEPSVKS